MDTAPWSALPSVRETAPVVLTIGRLEFRKAPEVLVEAAARVGFKRLPLHLSCGVPSLDAAHGDPD